VCAPWADVRPQAPIGVTYPLLYLEPHFESLTRTGTSLGEAQQGRPARIGGPAPRDCFSSYHAIMLTI